MATVNMTIRSAGLTRKLAKMSRAVNRGEFKPALNKCGIYIVEDLERNFESKGAVSTFGGWKPLSWVTAATRRPGRGKKMTTMDDVRAEARRLTPLQDKGQLRRTIATRMAIHAGNAQVRVGPAVRHGAIHQRGGSSTFHFDAEKQKNFDGNVRKVLSGRKSGTTPSGRKSRAKKNWNPDYFKMRAALTKMDGKTFKIPKRRFVWDMLKKGSNTRIRCIGEIARTVRQLTKGK